MRSDVMGHANSTFFMSRPSSALSTCAQLSALGIFALFAFASSLPIFGAFAFVSVITPLEAAFSSYVVTNGNAIMLAASLAATAYATL